MGETNEDEAYKRSRVATTVTNVNEQIENGESEEEENKRSYANAYARLASWPPGANANELNTIETTLYLDNNNSNSSGDDGDDDDNDSNDDDEDDDEVEGAQPKDVRALIGVNEANRNGNEEEEEEYYHDEYYYNNNYYDQHYYRSSKGTDTDDLY